MKKIFAAIVFISLFELAFSDGVYYKKVKESTAIVETIQEQAQKAFIYYNKDTKKETMFVEAVTDEFSGEFLWVLPIPEKELNNTIEMKEVKNSAEIFDGLNSSDKEIKVVEHILEEKSHSDNGFGCSKGQTKDSGGDYESAGKNEKNITPGLDIVKTSETENFKYQYFKITDLTKFYSWFSQNGYGTLNETAEIVYKTYYDKQFSFVLIEGKESTGRGLHSGIALEFLTSKPIFPMAISKIGMGQSMELELYIAATSSYKIKGYIDYPDELYYGNIFSDRKYDTNNMNDLRNLFGETQYYINGKENYNVANYLRNFLVINRNNFLLKKSFMLYGGNRSAERASVEKIIGSKNEMMIMNKFVRIYTSGAMDDIYFDEESSSTYKEKTTIPTLHIVKLKNDTKVIVAKNFDMSFMFLVGIMAAGRARIVRRK